MAKKIKDIKDLKFDNKNINKGSEYGSSLLAKSLQEVGAGRSVLADKNGVLIAGNKTVEKFGEAGLTKIQVVETTGDTLVVVQRTDLDINSPQGAKMKILDNTVSKHNYIEDAEVAEAVCEEFDLDASELGMNEKSESKEIKRVELKPFERTHVLLSFPPEKMIEIQEILQQLSLMPFIEYEQSSN
jgi:hypothetical protein